MPGGQDAGKATISRAGELADALSHFGDSDREIARATACYDSLYELAEDHSGSADIRDRLICGALRLAACHARRKDITAIRDVRNRLERYASGHPDDPGMRRGYCELSVTLCLEYTRQGKDADADRTFEEIRTVAAGHPTDRLLRSTLAKAISNRIAAHCDEGRTTAARHLHRSLCALAEVPNSRPDTMLHRANGTFNLATYLACSGAPKKALELYFDLAGFVGRYGPDPELSEVLADAGFALVTVFGDKQMLDPAETVYRDLQQRAAASDGMAGKVALAAFNLMTDFCRDGDVGKARQIYDDILALSAARPEDEEMAVVHAKACANLLLTTDALDDTAHADLLAQELAQLVAAWPDQAEIWEIAAGLAPLDTV
ncbi:hypothetical protein NUH88_14855 [Nisaea acidiphila]|uniref:Tetratricopeptide repeat protein n=1 Tax=Nisaea acidiphila TaxID=1862145 RepID=A0A9J7AP38_9PROT|nr:hypothetical protein [Nisaea acidiphila]UUX48682.1 hypothetical protein NUH88_14855 [Nisaea acidiphila]